MFNNRRTMYNNVTNETDTKYKHSTKTVINCGVKTENL